MQDPAETRRGPFVVTDSSEVYRNPWLSVREDLVIRPDESAGRFGIVDIRAGSTVLALDRDLQVVLAQEYKYGVNRVTLEAVSGGIDEGETPLAAAQRELQEELGLVADDWTWLGVIDPLTSVVSAPNHLFLAEGLHQGTRHRDPGEVITPVRMPFQRAFKCALEGDISHGGSVVAILKTALLLTARGIRL
ncbi:MAG: NUDIX hydrolase [Alphaproteobacteria bacterium]|nr:MAG: NUDIX hydrolase [Alphaproteobacteria bacterium]